MMEMSGGVGPVGLQQLSSTLHDRVKRDGLGLGYPTYIDGLYSIAEEQSTMEIIRLTAEIATIGAVLFISWMASQKYLGSQHGYTHGYPEYISPSIHSSYESGPSYSSYGAPPIHYETIKSYEPESIHYKEYQKPHKPSYYPQPEYKPDYEPEMPRPEYKPDHKQKQKQVKHEPTNSSYYPTPNNRPKSKQPYNKYSDQNYKREYQQQSKYPPNSHLPKNKPKVSHAAPKPGNGFHNSNLYQSNDVIDEYGMHEDEYAFDYDTSKYNEVEDENMYYAMHNSIQDYKYKRQKETHNQDNEYKRKSKYITVKPTTRQTETTTQYKLLTTTPFRYIISESENLDRIKSGNGIEFNNGWKPSFIPSEYIGSVKPGSHPAAITTKPPLMAHGFKKYDTELTNEKEAYDQFQDQINTFLTHDPYKGNNERVYDEPGPPYHTFKHDYNTDKIDYEYDYDVNEVYDENYNDEYDDENYIDYEYNTGVSKDMATSANKGRVTGGKDKPFDRKSMNYDPRKTKHVVVKKMSHEIGNDYTNQNVQQEEAWTAEKKEESKLIADFKQNIHDKDYSDYRPHNSYSNIIYSPPYAKAELLSTDPHKDQVYIQTLNPVIKPENVVRFSGVSINQAGDSMKRTMDDPEGPPVLNNSDFTIDNDNIDSESDKFVVVTPIGIIQTMNENEYEKLSNGLKLNDIHDFTYNGLNLEQRIYKKIVNEI